MDTNKKTAKILRISVEEVPYSSTSRLEKDTPPGGIGTIVSLSDIPTTTAPANPTSEYRIMEFSYGRDYSEPFFVRVGQENVVADLFHEFLRRRSLSLVDDITDMLGPNDQTPIQWGVNEPWFTLANGKNMLRDELRLKLSRLREVYV